jgi:hypothetical protein
METATINPPSTRLSTLVVFFIMPSFLSWVFEPRAQ